METKRCFKCFCEKPLDSFYKHKAMADGHLNKCKECTKFDVKNHRQENLEQVKAYDRSRDMSPHRVALRKVYARTIEGRIAQARALRKSNQRYPDRTKARRKLSNAIRDGKITPWPICAVPHCNCKPHGHHPDYSRPLDVVWLCDMHHKEAHRIGREIERNRQAE